MLNCIAIFIFSLTIGMVVGNLIKTKDHYHGPNALNFISKPYYYRKNGKCYKYTIGLIHK